MSARRVSSVAIGSVILAILALLDWSPGPASAVSGCPALPVTLRQLIAIERRADHPLSDAYPAPVSRYTEGGSACYGHRVIRFAAYLAQPEGLGGTSSFVIEPLWLWEGNAFVTPTSARDGGYYTGPFYPIAVPPALVARVERLQHHWVSITGAFADPRAATCSVTSGGPPDAPGSKQAIQICRTAFVVHSIQTIPKVPATDTAVSPSDPTSATAPGTQRVLLLVVLGMVAVAVATAMFRRAAGRLPGR